MVLQSAAELNIRAREKIVSSINSHSYNWLTLSSLLKKILKKTRQANEKNHYCSAHLNWPTDCRSSSPITEEESSKKLKAISLYQGLHFSLLGCKTTTCIQANTILYIVLNNTHETDHIMQPCLNVCMTSVKYRYTARILILFFLCETLGMRIMAKYLA